MTAINQTGNALTGSTGTGAFVGANSPTLITPVLGAATATSINFGGSSLSTYVDTTSWTPAFVFSTLGDLSVSYATQQGSYQRIGNLVIASFFINFTPTFTTASGNVQINGLPFTAAANPAVNIGSCYIGSVVWSVIYTLATIDVYAGNNYILIGLAGSNVGHSNISSTTATITSGAQIRIGGTVTYMI